VDRLLADSAGKDLPFEVLRRRIFGVGSQGARLVLEESRRTGRSAGEVLTDRIEALLRGDADPVLYADGDPLQAAERGELDENSLRLLPWLPDDPAEAAHCTWRQDPAATAGWYHEAVERAAAVDQRLSSLRGLLQREIIRLREAEEKVANDLRGFEDPDQYRRWGEALLAGLHRARRVGEVALVPDPYDPEGAEIGVPASPDRSLQQAADDHFRNHRRARRGLEQARRRAEWLARRRSALDELEWEQSSGRGRETILALERGMREEGIPVGLEPATKAGRAAANRGRPRLEGVRVFASSEGTLILVGRAGRHNHRLTFKLAAPDDFWLHARGFPGAHVVVRNERKSPRPTEETLREAAALAAWFSNGREQDLADVQWTRRKYVRHPRGAPPGTVILKRFETVRVRPGLPPGFHEKD
jgi:predicted ribosome quality control (RQC) complex YloA/Tae2 family protein